MVQILEDLLKTDITCKQFLYINLVQSFKELLFYSEQETKKK